MRPVSKTLLLPGLPPASTNDDTMINSLGTTSDCLETLRAFTTVKARNTNLAVWPERSCQTSHSGEGYSDSVHSESKRSGE